MHYGFMTANFGDYGDPRLLAELAPLSGNARGGSSTPMICGERHDNWSVAGRAYCACAWKSYPRSVCSKLAFTERQLGESRRSECTCWSRAECPLMAESRHSFLRNERVMRLLLR